MIRLQANVEGLVQGVGFRYWAHHTATRLGIPGGVVKNGPDGTVEIEAEAPERPVLEAFFHELHIGPSAAQVTAVRANWEENTEAKYTSFRVS
jgi:acylphosphatase